MRASHLLVFSLCGALLGCGTEGETASDPVARSEDPAGARVRDGGRADASRDAGKPLGDPNACQTIELPKNPAAPQILIVQDRSGSMVGVGAPKNMGKNRWLPSASALKKLTSELTDTVAFGLMLFPASTSSGSATSPIAGCDQGKVDVAVGTGTADAIASALDRSTPDVGATPTAASLTAALGEFETLACQGCREPPKYVLLVTDGQPSCGLGGTTTVPQDLEATNAALDALRAAGIMTYVIGYDTASDRDAAAAMESFAQHGGTEKYLPVEDEATLLAELTRIAGALIPCQFELSDDVLDASFVRVEIDGVSYEYGRDWLLEGRTVSLLPTGGACTKLRDARLHDLAITRECTPVVLL
jgi:hypothetical protein